MSTLSRVVLLTAPSASANVVSQSRIDLSWPAVIGAASYRVYRGGTLVDSPTGLTSSSTGLTASTLYSFQVSTVDAAGLEGPKGSAFTATTAAAPDTTGPTAPVITVATVSSSAQTVSRTTAATDSGSGVASYELQRATNIGFTTGLVTTAVATGAFPVSVTGLSASTQYYYRSRAIDVAGNNGTYSAIVNATTSASSSGLSPTPESTGGTKVFDSRTGGTQSTQSATTLAAWKTAYTTGAPPGTILWDATYGASSVVITDSTVGGAGVRTRQANWTASSSEEHASLLGWSAESGNTIIPAGQSYYIQGKFYIPSGVTLGGVNPHWKVIFLNKVNDGSGRLYFGFYGTDYMTFKIDERSVDIPFNAAGAPLTSVWGCRDQIIQMTAFINPSSVSATRLWMKCTGVTGGEVECTRKPSEGNDGSGLNPSIGVGGFQENGTLYTNGGSGYSLHTWDWVIWY